MCWLDTDSIVQFPDDVTHDIIIVICEIKFGQIYAYCRSPPRKIRKKVHNKDQNMNVT